MLNKIDHIGIAVRSIEEKIPLYRDVLGLEFLGEEVVESQHVRVAFFQIGESMIELLEPTSDSSPIAKFLEKNGEGIHHICLDVDNTDEALKSLDDKGVALIDKVGRKGLAGRVGFIHPKSTNGVLIELAQKV